MPDKGGATMLDAKIESALNEQISHELASAYLYAAG